MKKIINLISLLFLGILSVNAQSNLYYYYKGEKIYLTLDKSKLNITTTTNFQKSTSLFSDFKDFELVSDSSNGINSKFGKIEFQTQPNDSTYYQKINSLKSNNSIIAVSPYFVSGDSSSIGTSSIFYVKLKNANDYQLLQMHANAKNVVIVKQNKFMPLWYRLSTTANTQGNSLDMANYFYETELFENVDPAFIFNFKSNCTTNDPYLQWGLYNSVNPNYDINACEAWDVTQGEGIKVAVFDDGIDKTHLDLINNISDLSYDSHTGTSPSVFIQENDHGTHVAGIIGAEKDNNIFGTGVAPKSKLISISKISNMSNGIVVGEEYADGINWAWEPEYGGADIINNSWGDHAGLFYNQMHSILLEESIDDALAFGRNGKGTIVVFASGNFTSVDYPANHNPDIICVGNFSPETGKLEIGSGSGNELDAVAPGHWIYSTLPNQGFGSMNGTSMAAPHVSGIAALILSVNPDLTQKQVSDIIELTTQKVNHYYSNSNSYIYNYNIEPNRPNGKWDGTQDGNMGYGLVDAYAAVRKAQCFLNKNLVNGSINTNTTWNTDVYAYGTITIEEGVALTITSKVSCDSSTMFVVKPGAQLIVNGGILTSSDCDSTYWSGIRVLGQRNVPQYASYQGKLILRNARIENARNAISFWYPDDWNSTGGIVDASNTLFKNNIRSVEYMPFTNFSQNTNPYPLSNVGKFENCTFEWDINMYENDNEQLNHVTLYGVNGVKFISCDFKNSLSYSNTLERHGIYSIEAGYIVTGNAIDGVVDRSEFTNLNYGIKASNADPNIIDIQNSYFNDNHCGIFAISSDNVRIINNEFNIPPVFKMNYEAGMPFGVAIYKSSGFTIEQNVFHSFISPSVISVGLQINNSGSSSNKVRNNTFDNLTYATQAIGNNTGLQYLCNDFTTSENCIDIFKDYQVSNNGICFYQNGGGNNISAENLFSQDVGIYNEPGCSNIHYYYTNGENKEPNISGNVYKHLVDYNVNCTRNYDLLDNTSLNNTFITLENDYINLLYNYNNLLDGGSTDDLLDKIQNSWDGDVWNLREEFLGQSPYLSPEVLKELALSERLPLPVYLEIALSNPEATQKDEYIDFMKSDEGINILTTNGVELITDSWNTKTFRATVESNISSKLSDMEDVTREQIYRIINDTTGFNINNYRSLLNNIRNINGKYEMIESYMFTKEYEMAREILSNLLTDPNNVKYNSTNINDYFSLISIIEERDSLTNQIPLDDRIYELSQSSTRAGSKSKAYLDFYDSSTNYHPDYIVIDTNLKGKKININKPLNAYEADVSALPNPAKDYIAISYNLKPQTTEYMIKIYDNKGIVVYSGSLKGNKGIQNIDTRTFNSGTYVYNVENGNERCKSGKFIIVR